MRILMVHNLYKEEGGENLVFRTESELLSKQGHDVECLVFDNSTIKTFADKCLSGLKAIYNPESERVVRRRIENFRPDIIHVHNFLPLASPSVLFAAKKHNVPLVITLHNYRLICPSATLFHNDQVYEKSINSVFPLDAILKGVYRNSVAQTLAVALMCAIHHIIGTWKNKVDLYIALTHFAKEKFKNSTLHISERQLIIKPNFVIDRGVGNSVRKNFFLFVGRLTEEKGIRTLLTATELHDFSLTIIGTGPLTQLVQDFAARNSKIQYLGFQDNSTIINYTKECQALIVPSIWYEGCPLTILEAFSTATPVIASRLGGMIELIQDGANGLHFKAGDEVDLVSKISAIKQRHEWARSLGNQARQTYLAQYTPEKNLALLTRIYEKAIEVKRQETKKVSNHLEPQLDYL